MSKPGFFAWYEWRYSLGPYKGKKRTRKTRPKGLPILIPLSWWRRAAKMRKHKPAPVPVPPPPKPTPTPVPPPPSPKPKPKPKPFHVLQGVDGVSVPSGAALKAAGKHFAGRYISTPGNPKNITRAEAADFHAHGIGVLIFFETTGVSFEGGFAAGKHDATSALIQLGQLKVPRVNKDGSDIAVYFTIDTDPHGHEAQIVSYIKGAASVLGKDHVGVYGGYGTIAACYQAAACRYFCQAYAWSYGRWHPAAHVQQYLNGQHVAGHQVDLDRQMKAKAGLWLP